MVINNSPDNDTHLVDAVKQAGGYEVLKPTGWDDTKSINDALGDSHIRFFPDLPKIDWSSLVDCVFRILAIKIVEDWDNARFGKSSFPLFLIDFEDGRKVTTLGSGIAIFNQAFKLNKAKACPVKVKLIMKAPESPAGQPYYYLDGA
jgi:hypothetical protein